LRIRACYEVSQPSCVPKPAQLLPETPNYFGEIGRRIPLRLRVNASERYQQAIAALAAGRYREGFAGYDARWEAAGIPRPAVTDAAIVGSEWRGESLSGKRLLLHAEQGLGDCIQFLRYVPLVKALGPEIILEVRPALRELCALLRSPCPIGNGTPPRRFDLHCSLLSLPAIFGTSIETLPPPSEFCLPKSVCDRWRRHIPKSERKNIGLVWAGNPEHPHDAQRSIGFDRLSPILETDQRRLRFFSFQLGPAALNTTSEKVLNLAPHLTSFVETATALLQMQLVITVDTAVAHLAGSLGVPTWLLLPFVSSWRWMRDRTDAPWYPSMRLLRQPAPGDWHRVISQLKDRL
jgi:Glycosyltransferase family 9 (heptosyltransferase)